LSTSDQLQIAEHLQRLQHPAQTAQAQNATLQLILNILQQAQQSPVISVPQSFPSQNVDSNLSGLLSSLNSNVAYMNPVNIQPVNTYPVMAPGVVPVAPYIQPHPSMQQMMPPTPPIPHQPTAPSPHEMMYGMRSLHSQHQCLSHKLLYSQNHQRCLRLRCLSLREIYFQLTFLKVAKT